MLDLDDPVTRQLIEEGMRIAEARERRIRALSLPFGRALATWLVWTGVRLWSGARSIYHVFLRTWNRWRDPSSFCHRCYYCGKLTRQAPYVDSCTGRSWPSCCSRLRCLDRWDSEEGR